jgi:hypothetical protein
VNMLEISIAKVAQVIVRSREVDGKVAPWDEPESLDADDETAATILEDLPGDATREELQSFLLGLNGDEKASLIALAWVGRGTYAPEELVEAVATAKSEHATNATRYLLQLPLLADYLSDALEQLGISPADEELKLTKQL